MPASLKKVKLPPEPSSLASVSNTQPPLLPPRTVESLSRHSGLEQCEPASRAAAEPPNEIGSAPPRPGRQVEPSPRRPPDARAAQVAGAAVNLDALPQLKLRPNWRVNEDRLPSLSAAGHGSDLEAVLLRFLGRLAKEPEFTGWRLGLVHGQRVRAGHKCPLRIVATAATGYLVAVDLTISRQGESLHARMECKARARCEVVWAWLVGLSAGVFFNSFIYYILGMLFGWVEIDSTSSVQRYVLIGVVIAVLGAACMVLVCLIMRDPGRGSLLGRLCGWPGRDEFDRSIQAFSGNLAGQFRSSLTDCGIEETCITHVGRQSR